MTVVQRTSSDLRLNPHLHVVFLDGAYQDGMPDEELVWCEHGHLQTREVGAVLEKTRRRMHRWLHRRGALQSADDDDESDDAEANLAASAGPQWGLPPLDPRDEPLCASLDGFRPSGTTKPVRVLVTRSVFRADGLVRITLSPSWAHSGSRSAATMAARCRS